MYDLTIAILIAYSDKYLFMPTKNWSIAEYDRRAYSRWAVDELIYLLREESLKLPPHISGRDLLEPIEIIHQLFDDVDYYHSISENEKTRSIFLAAKETIQDIMWLIERRNNE